MDTNNRVVIDEIVGALTSDDGLTCCSADSLLPSVSGVVSISSELRELLFPGYARSRRLQQHDHRQDVTRRLRQVRSHLRVEISRALVHARTATLRLHTEGCSGPATGSPAELTDRFLGQLPQLRQVLQTDVQAAFDGDPAARTYDEIVLCYPGILATTMYRVAHALHSLSVPYLPRIMTEWAHRKTGIDIHPGAVIGPRFFVDHGTGVVIGETSEIGAGVTLYQGVTLGAWSFPRDEEGNLVRGTKRHPTLEDNVTVYSNASILGGTTVIGKGSQIGSSVTISRSVPPNTIVTLDKPSLRYREAA